jgi:uncharacterized protein (UPF0276 family)
MAEVLHNMKEEAGPNPVVAVSELKGDNVLDEETIKRADLIELKFDWWQKGESDTREIDESKKEKLIHLLPYLQEGERRVYLNIGDKDFPERIREFDLPEKIQKINPKWVSFHLMYSASHVEQAVGNDQYDSVKTTEPLPSREEFLKTVCQNVRRAREMFGKEVLLENIEYVPEKYSHGLLRFVTEPDFIRQVLEETDSGMLLDLEHAYVAAKNMGMRYIDYLKALPLERVREIHLSRPSSMKRSAALIKDWGKEPTEDDLKHDVLVDDHKPLVDKDGKFTKRVEVILGEIWKRLSALEVLTLELNLPKDEMDKNVKLVREIVKDIKAKKSNETE